MNFQVIIPARYASVRLPGKPLLDIGGRPMLAHVYARACESGATRVIIATDDARIQQAAIDFGAEVRLTAAHHQSGTDRLAEVAAHEHFCEDTIVVNLQGDEPLMPPALIHQVAEDLAAHPTAQVATVCEPIQDWETVFNPHVVKVVRDLQGFALYFSRAPVPWLREGFSTDSPLWKRGDRGDLQNSRVENPPRPPFSKGGGESAAFQPGAHYRHIGLYAYRAGYLQTFTRLPPADLERYESLEQLRVLAHGGRIHVADACAAPGPGVDTAEDLAQVRKILHE